MQKLPKILLWVFMAISILFTLLYMTGSVGEGPYIVWSYILLAIGIIIALIFPLINLFSSPKSIKRFLFTLIGLAVLVFISYSLAGDEVLQLQNDSPYNTPDSLKKIGAGIFGVYILLAIAVGSIFFSEIAKKFK